MTSHEDLVNAHLIVSARINADTAAALRRIVERIDNGDVEYDGFGGKIVSHE